MTTKHKSAIDAETRDSMASAIAASIDASSPFEREEIARLCSSLSEHMIRVLLRESLLVEQKSLLAMAVLRGQIIQTQRTGGAG